MDYAGLRKNPLSPFINFGKTYIHTNLPTAMQTSTMRCCKYNVPESSGWHPRKVQIDIHLFNTSDPTGSTGQEASPRISGALMPNQHKAMTFHAEQTEAKERKYRAGKTHYYLSQLRLPGSERVDIPLLRLNEPVSSA
jgi:hypothetical protein